MSMSALGIISIIDARVREIGQSYLQFQFGTVAAYDEKSMTVTVKPQPDGLPIPDVAYVIPWTGTPGGNPSGCLGAPSEGTQVLVLAMDEAGTHRVCIPSTFNAKNSPVLPVPSGEWWSQHTSGAYFKLLNNQKTLVGSPTEIELISPLVVFTDDVGNTPDTTHSVVRKSDLQELIDWINNSLIPWAQGHVHLGNLGAPTSAPLTAALLLNTAAATASSVARAL